MAQAGEDAGLLPPIIGPVTDPGARGSKQVDIDYYGHRYKLMTSAILYKQASLRAFDKIFCIAPNVRLEPLETAGTNRHLAEFHQLDVEVAGASREQIVQLVEDLVRHVVRGTLAALPETAPVVAAYRLAPEAARLLDLAAGYVPLGSLAAVRNALEPEIAAELRRRERTGAQRVIAPRRGVLLRRTVTREGWDQARLLPFGCACEGGAGYGSQRGEEGGEEAASGEGELLLTPVGDYLLTERARVTPERREAALAALRRWDGMCW
ncbi:amino acid--tRNA ligase-related protein [Kitasatospora sp. NPDC050543]|uniref:amino acid--tRNA ligase-related protein n=1 Tax=Kitasatospora sp. NPDC050543 TaxID=3364054 RepID=UPI0037A8FDD1